MMLDVPFLSSYKRFSVHSENDQAANLIRSKINVMKLNQHKNQQGVEAMYRHSMQIKSGFCEQTATN